MNNPVIETKSIFLYELFFYRGELLVRLENTVSEDNGKDYLCTYSFVDDNYFSFKPTTEVIGTGKFLTEKEVKDLQSKKIVPSRVKKMLGKL